MDTDTPDFLPDDAQLAEVLRGIDFDTTEGLAELHTEYKQAREALSAANYAQASGISLAAFADLAQLAYQPSAVYPAMLRLGELSPIHSAELNEKLGDIPYYHDLGQVPNLLLDLPERAASNALLQNIALRLLASLEARLLNLYCVDAAELGRAFADLADIAEPLRPQRILTETADIEQLLKTLKAHSVSLMQDALGNRFASLQAFNAEAGDLVEPYRFLFIANFPHGFSPHAVELLLSLLGNAAQAGLSVLMSLDHEALEKHRGLADTLQQHPQLAMLADGKISRVEGSDFLSEQFNIFPDKLLAPNVAAIIHAANQQASQTKQRTVQASLPEQPFTQSSSDGISIPIGQSGRGKPCSVRLGTSDSPHHGLIGGTAGSGKSVLLHNIILNGAWLYAPEELSFLLLDYKEGTEFKLYEDLPHVRVLAVESSRAFGLSVFEYVQDVIRERGNRFKEVGIATLAEYRSKTGEAMPRILLVIDEFQLLIKGNDTISKKVISLMDDVARRGRSFGIHLLLSTQTLHGVDIQESTLSNTKLRIGLQMTESDAVKVFHRDNTVPAGLRQAGDAWLNEAHGQRDGNVRLQVAWLAPEERQTRVNQLALAAGESHEPRHIFTGVGHAKLSGTPAAAWVSRLPAKAQSRFADALVARPAYISDQALGLRLRRETASNILLVGNAAEDACGLTLLMLYQYLRQSTAESRVYMSNLLAVDSPYYDYLDVLQEQCPDQVTLVDNTGLEAALEQLDNLLVERTNDRSKAADRIMLCIMNVQNARCFKRTGGLSVPAATKRLEHLVHEGGQYGIHVVLYCQRHQDFHELFQNPSAMLNDFENRIALHGGNSEKILSNLHDPVQHAGMAYILSPQARYGIDPAYLYRAGDILDLFADLSSQGV